MPEFIPLEVSQRETLGKKVKQMRREGLVPAIVYGPDTEPIPLTIDRRTLRHVLGEAGGTQIIELNIDGRRVPTLARDVQRDPLRGDILHVDFYKVAMDRAISADVPVMIVGENPLLESGAAVLAHSLTSLSVEALPMALPQAIEVDISGLEEVGDQVLVSELTLPEGVIVLTDESELVVKLDYPTMIEEEEEELEEELLFAEEGAEPEVITERREEEEEE